MTVGPRPSGPIETLTADGMAALLGIPRRDLTEDEVRMIGGFDLRFRRPAQAERDDILLEVVRRLETDAMSASGRHRHADWERGWSENLAEFRRSGFDLDALVPKYIRPDRPVRLVGDYAYPLDPRFELGFYTVLRNWLFRTHLAGAQAIYEFGCGTGYNLVVLSGIFPGKPLFGLDWAEASVELVGEIARSRGLNMTGLRFDMYQPDMGIEVPPGSAFVTMNSMEQLGSEHSRLLEFFLAKRPSVCVHAEPFYELYEEHRLLDYLAMRYHRKRNYLTGFLPALEGLAREGRIEIMTCRRIPFGSLFHEGYSLVTWRPRPSA